MPDLQSMFRRVEYTEEDPKPQVHFSIAAQCCRTIALDLQALVADEAPQTPSNCVNLGCCFIRSWRTPARSNA